MIRKLRLRFALSAIISVLIVLIVMLVSINALNYVRTVINDSDRILQMMSENGGRLPEAELPGNKPVKGPGRIEPSDLTHESHCFSISYDPSGSIIRTDTEHIFNVSDDQAAEYAEEALSSGKAKGFIGNYRYSVVDTPDGGKMAVFCDCTSKLFSFRSFREVSILISLILLVIVSAAIVFVSGKAVRPVAESYEKQRRFITDAGHEIKTPLAIISADSDVLMTDVGEDNEWLVDIKKQTGRLTELTDELMMLSKMEEGTLQLKSEKIDLSSMVEDQVDSFSILAQNGNKDIEASIDKDVFVTGDRKSLYELLSILLENAVKYCPDGKKINVRCHKDDRNARIEVSNDTAEDISNDSLNNLFDRFYRTDASRNSETGGHGIGLSIAKAITEANKGRITVTKDRPNTIRFTVTFRSA